MLYEVLKALHIISVIAWMAGLLYLPRLFVYHADAEKGSVQSETFKTMERRLLRGIMNPAMILTWTFGLLLSWQGEWWHAGWWHAKFALVCGLTVVHHLYGRWRKEFAESVGAVFAGVGYAGESSAAKLVARRMMRDHGVD